MTRVSMAVATHGHSLHKRLDLSYNEFMNRPETTLFMLMSVDGKISTGDTDILDVDQD